MKLLANSSLVSKKHDNLLHMCTPATFQKTDIDIEKVIILDFL